LTQDFVTKHFSQNAAWWHWSADVWLFRFTQEKSAAELRDEVGRLLPGTQVLTMKFDDQDSEWAGYGPKQWMDWFMEYWEKKLITPSQRKLAENYEGPARGLLFS